MSVPSIGDILMLSQTAWKVGRAFTAGRKNVPAEFLEIEAEINGLAKSLKLLAEAMFDEADDSILKQADQDTLDGIATVLSACQQTIQDLDSLMDQYQVIKKTRTQGGFAIERSWSDMVLAQYQTMMWTAEGGNIRHLRHLLQMHTSIIGVTTKALQSKSISRLENVVAPMAEKVDSIHHSSGSLDLKLIEATRIVKEIAEYAAQSPVRQESPSLNLKTPQQSLDLSGSFSAQQLVPPRKNSMFSRPMSPLTSRSPELRSPDMSTTLVDSPTLSMTSFPTTPAQKRMSARSCVGPSSRSSGSYTSSDGHLIQESCAAHRRTATLSRQTSANASSTVGRSPSSRESRSRPDSRVLPPMLPPPAIGLPPHPEIDQAMSISSLSIHPSQRSEIVKLHRSSTTLSQKDQFEREAFRNSAILCDVRGMTVEYAHKVSPEENSHDVEMVEACLECRVAVVRKREAAADAKQDIRMMTSIWVFSDDNTLRIELKMADGEMYVPYSSYFSPEKVSVTVPCELKFHDVKFGQRVVKTAKTTWINYIFESAHGAALFQNELMGRTLLGTFRTSKTLRIHEGLSGAFSYAEQMCGMENLRIWEDNETLAVIALIHFSPQFRNGYLAFYLNSANSPIKTKDEGAKEIKIKGLRVPLEKGMGRKDSVVDAKEDVAFDKRRMVTGARIEFATEVEKKEFLALVREVQRDMRELPTLAGVN